LPDTDREQLIVEAMSSEALTTSEIEGEILDRASVQSSIRRQLGIATDKRNVRPAEDGIAEMLIDLCRSTEEALTEEMLLSWHRKLVKGRRDLRDVGRYRTGKDAMQVVSGAIYSPKVHFEAPPTTKVPKEMASFIKWFNRTAPRGAQPLPALTRAGSPIFTLSRSILSKMATGVSGARSQRKLSRKGPAIRRLAPSRKPFCSAENPTMRRLKQRTRRTRLRRGWRGLPASALKRSDGHRHMWSS
jgi:hypothetical protein